jgi:hypothetical protein
MPQNPSVGRSSPAIVRAPAALERTAAEHVVPERTVPPPTMAKRSAESREASDVEFTDVEQMIGGLEAGDSTGRDAESVNLDSGDFDDVDVIVVEDDPTPPPPPPTNTSAVRRQEYRQLFARLRRG